MIDKKIVLEKLEELTSFLNINEYNKELPDCINTIADFEYINYAFEGIYIRYFDQNFSSFDSAQEVLKYWVENNLDDATYQLLTGGLNTEKRQFVYYEDENDGQLYVDDIDDYQTNIENLKEYAEELEELYDICIYDIELDINFLDNIEQIIIEKNAEELDDELKVNDAPAKKIVKI